MWEIYGIRFSCVIIVRRSDTLLIGDNVSLRLICINVGFGPTSNAIP
jgi:hypothetical protein